MRRWSVVLRGIALAGLPIGLASAMVIELGVLDERQSMSPRGNGTDSWAQRERRRAEREDVFWWGNEFARRWEDVPDLPVEVRAETERPGRVDRLVSVIERVNPAMLRLLHRSGRIVLFEGRITDQEEHRELRGVTMAFYTHRGYVWDDSPGLYCPSTKTAFVKTDRPLARSRHTLLHELGHMLDHSLGRPSETDSFRRVTEADDRIDDLGYPEHIADRNDKQSEYFADSFAHLNESVEKRLWMQARRPAASRWFDDLLRRTIEAGYAELERELDRDLVRRRERRLELAASRGELGPGSVRRR